MPKIDKSKIQRILVITLTNIGDIILTTPVVEALLREFPGTPLDVMVGPNGKEIFSSHRKVNDVIIYDKKSSTLAKFGLFLNLRKRRYDLVVDLRNTVLPLVLGARFITNPFRHGNLWGRIPYLGRMFRRESIPAGNLWRQIPYLGRMFRRESVPEKVHKKDVHLSRLSDIGIDTHGSDFYIPILESDKQHVEQLLDELQGKPFVAVSPGAKSHVKRWPLKYYAKLCDTLKDKMGYETVLVGNGNDRVVIERIISCMKTTPINFLEKLNLRELAYLTKKSNLLITNDSAPLHVGNAVRATILAFFGPTDEKKYGPLTRAPKNVLKKDIECAPCEVAQCVKKENKYECLKSISVDEAFQAAKQLLKGDVSLCHNPNQINKL